MVVPSRHLFPLRCQITRSHAFPNITNPYLTQALSTSTITDFTTSHDFTSSTINILKSRIVNDISPLHPPKAHTTSLGFTKAILPIQFHTRYFKALKIHNTAIRKFHNILQVVTVPSSVPLLDLLISSLFILR